MSDASNDCPEGEDPSTVLVASLLAPLVGLPLALLSLYFALRGRARRALIGLAASAACYVLWGILLDAVVHN